MAEEKNLLEAVEERIAGSAILQPHRVAILAARYEPPQTLEWLLTASDEEIAAWAQTLPRPQDPEQFPR